MELSSWYLRQRARAFTSEAETAKNSSKVGKGSVNAAVSMRAAAIGKR